MASNSAQFCSGAFAKIVCSILESRTVSCFKMYEHKVNICSCISNRGKRKCEVIATESDWFFRSPPDIYLQQIKWNL